MANRVIRSSFRPVGKKRATTWLASADITSVSSIAAAASILSQSFAFTSEDVTVVRTRGVLYWGTDQEAATERPFGALGMCVVGTPAATAGVASLPTPITDEDSDLWFLHESVGTDLRFLDATGVGFNTFREMRFDSKAMRKVVAGETIVVVLENADSTGGVQFILKFRMLVKLHS